MSAPSRRGPGGPSGEVVLLWVALLTVIGAVTVVNLSLRIGDWLAGAEREIQGDPFAVLFGVLSGHVAWTPEATGTAAALTALLLLLGAGGRLLHSRGDSGSRRADRAARSLGRGADLETMTARRARKHSVRLGMDASPGVHIGTTVVGGTELAGSWEDMHLNISGPRTGKSMCFAIPSIVAAPGPVVATSNKRDVLDATRGARAEAGEIWVFDPQQLAGERASWWWDPLSAVTDDVQAGKLAEHFANGSREPGAKADAFFDPAAKDLLAALLLAGAVGDRAITEVYTWLTRPGDDEAVDLLREAGYALLADQVSGVLTAPDRQRAGIFGTAQQMAACLTSRAMTPWITAVRAEGQPERPVFDPKAFVRGTNTLYSLSREGQGSAGPIVTALTVAVADAAEELAAASPGGRLEVPLLGVLDEAANVCRWRSLPDLYSHYGSRGIVLMTILQSWSQGVDVWGESGMRKLWSAANIKIYGGGVSEAGFLDDLSKLVGEHDREVTSLSTGRGHRTVSRQLRRERILDIAELAALPRGRALVLASGSRPTLVKTRPWTAGPHAERIRRSLAEHGA